MHRSNKPWVEQGFCYELSSFGSFKSYSKTTTFIRRFMQTNYSATSSKYRANDYWASVCVTVDNKTNATCIVYMFNDVNATAKAHGANVVCVGTGDF